VIVNMHGKTTVKIINGVVRRGQRVRLLGLSPETHYI
jgi:hypothetical protein